jgi:hypothetical protein
MSLITVYKDGVESLIAPNRLARYKGMGWSTEKPAPEPKKVAPTPAPAPKKAETTVKTSGTESK